MNRKVWTPAEEAYLWEHYANGLTRAIAAHLGRTVGKVYAKAKKLGLAKTAEYLSDPKNNCHLFPGTTTGASHRFVKGLVPPNKGVKHPVGWGPGRMKETQFRKGQLSGKAAQNWRPIGTILADPEGYLRIKVREAAHGKEPTGFGNTKVWPMYSRWLWEQQKGAIPPKHIVAFKDGNRTNCVIGNLELLSKADNARRNNMWARLPRELAEVIQLNGVLKRRIRREQHGKEQNQ